MVHSRPQATRARPELLAAGWGGALGPSGPFALVPLLWIR